MRQIKEVLTDKLLQAFVKHVQYEYFCFLVDQNSELLYQVLRRCKLIWMGVCPHITQLNLILVMVSYRSMCSALLRSSGICYKTIASYPYSYRVTDDLWKMFFFDKTLHHGVKGKKMEQQCGKDISMLNSLSINGVLQIMAQKLSTKKDKVVFYQVAKH